jgi:LPXTG-motif cell wall-anchored protein
LRHALSSTAKRSFALIGAAAVGIIAALGASAPAFACQATVKPTTDCIDGKPEMVRVTWKLINGTFNGKQDPDATITDAISPVGAIANGAKLPEGGTLVGTADVKKSVGTVTLAVTVNWPTRSIKQVINSPIDVSDVGCTPAAAPTSKYTPKCNGSVDAVITNPKSTEATFKVAAANLTGGGWPKSVTIKANDKTAVSVPSHAGAITVTEGETAVGAPFTWSKPEGCSPPDVTAKATCDGRSVVITNPSENAPLDATVTSNNVVQKVKVKAGTSETVTIAKDIPVLDATVKIGANVTTVNFDTAKDCVGTSLTNTTPPANAAPTLPRTGTNVALIAGGSAILIGLGGALFWLARRRRIQFTA